MESTGYKEYQRQKVVVGFIRRLLLLQFFQKLKKLMLNSLRVIFVLILCELLGQEGSMLIQQIQQ